MKHLTEWTDEMLKAAILGSEAQRETVFSYLYRKSGWQQWVIRYVKADGGDTEDGHEVFQESIIWFDQNIRWGRFEGKSTLQTYFYGIVKKVWVNWKRKFRPSSGQMPEYPDPSGEIEKTLLDKER